MCGIVGIHSLDGAKPIDPAVLGAMNDSITHRGPDSAGVYVDPGRVGLAMRRLSIIDVAGGDQPIGNEDGTVQVVYNGEIYNFQERAPRARGEGPPLRDPHRHGGHRPRLRAVRRRLRRALPGHVRVRALGHAPGAAPPRARPRGREAALLHRRRRAAPLRLRDQGAAPAPGRRAAAPAGGGQPLPDLPLRPRAPHHVRGRRGAPRGARPRRRSAAAWTCARTGSSATRSTRASRPTPPCAACASTSRTPCATCLVSDVPLGAFLSGGIDSGAVVALMAKYTPGRVNTFSIGYATGGEAFDERAFAREVAERYGTRAPRVRDDAGRARDRAAPRPRLRPALRGLDGDPDLVPLRADAPPRDGRPLGPRRRRARRGLRAPPGRPPGRAPALDPLVGAPRAAAPPRERAARPGEREPLGPAHQALRPAPRSSRSRTATSRCSRSSPAPRARRCSRRASASRSTSTSRAPTSRRARPGRRRAPAEPGALRRSEALPARRPADAQRSRSPWPTPSRCASPTSTTGCSSSPRGFRRSSSSAAWSASTC